MEWIKSLPCVVSGCLHLVDNMHIEGDGAGRKASYTKIVACCRKHHLQMHRVGRETFEGAHLLDLAALALDTERCWRRYTNTGGSHVR